jgi:hypothetical protein
MKQADNNEMELLLRSLAKQKGLGSVSDDEMSEARVNEMHLDADELNSYAEGVLPAPARARYTAHLADCARCRGIVTQLTLETGASDRQEQIEQQTRVTFWQKLGVFFSPPVLRYAIPAVAVFAVIALGLVALRQQRLSEFVAQNEPTASKVAATETSTTGLKGRQENSAPVTTADQPLVKSSNAVLPADKEKKGNTKNEVAQAGSADSVFGGSGKESPESAVAANAPRPSYAPEPAAVPPAARPQTTLADSVKPAIAPKEKSAERDAPSQQREDVKTRAKDEAAEDRVAVAKPQVGSAAGSSVEGNRAEEARRSSRARGQVQGNTENETETRTVAGRRFRRQGNVWVDTAYESSRPIINVARGSEQYRALVADEPNIRTIAEQLSGEVIAVWKGRVYRLH